MGVIIGCGNRSNAGIDIVTLINKCSKELYGEMSERRPQLQTSFSSPNFCICQEVFPVLAAFFQSFVI
jgi:hypothetical protein